MMIEQKCWYVLDSQDKIVAVGTAPMDENDAASRNERIVECDYFESDLTLIKTIENRRPILKDIVEVFAERAADDIVNIHVASETYIGKVALRIYDAAVEVDANSVTPLVVLPGYPLGIWAIPSEAYVIKFKEGAQ